MNNLVKGADQGGKEAAGTVSVPLSSQDSPQSTIWKPTSSWAFNLFFFSDFSRFPLVFSLLRELCLALAGEANPACNRKGTRSVAASRSQGRGPSRASTCNIPLQIFSSFQLFSEVCLAGSPRGISLFNTCLLQPETRRLNWRHSLLSIHI